MGNCPQEAASSSSPTTTTTHGPLFHRCLMHPDSTHLECARQPQQCAAPADQLDASVEAGPYLEEQLVGTAQHAAALLPLRWLPAPLCLLLDEAIKVLQQLQAPQ